MEEKKFQKIFMYVFHESAYKEQFMLSYRNKLYDFSVILLWKVFIIFSYEKITQYRKIKGDDGFDIIFKSGGLEKENLIKYDIENIFTYNKIEDDKLINLLSRIYSIDDNFFKKSRFLKNIRDVAAHVTDSILANTEGSLVSFREDLEKIINTINEFHFKKFLSGCDFEIISNLELSRIDKAYVLDALINELAVVLSFDSAMVLMEKIIKFKDDINEIYLKKILEKSLENINGAYNQVLENSFSIKFFQDLLAFSYKRDYELESWKFFYNNLDDKLKKKFSDIRISLKRRGVKGIINPEGIYDIEDIPF